MELLGMEIDVGTVVGKLVFLGVVVAIALVIQRLLGRVTRRALEAADAPNASIFINIERAVIWSLALVAVLKPVFNIDPTAVVTALGVTSVVISLGLQDTVSNVIGGLGITVSRVVKPGDMVTVDGCTGTVVDTNWRSTILRDRYGTEYIIPNSKINSTSVKHVNRWDQTVAKLSVVAAPGANLDAVTADVVATVGEALGPKLEPGYTTEVQVSELAPYGAKLTINIHVKDDVSLSAAVDAAGRALLGKPWLASAEAVAA